MYTRNERAERKISFVLGFEVSVQVTCRNGRQILQYFHW